MEDAQIHSRSESLASPKNIYLQESNILNHIHIRIMLYFFINILLGYVHTNSNNLKNFFN
jgi:hypothetical protein